MSDGLKRSGPDFSDEAIALLGVLHAPDRRLLAKEDPILAYQEVDVSGTEGFELIEEGEAGEFKGVYLKLGEDRKRVCEKIVLLRWLSLQEQAIEKVLVLYESVELWDEVNENTLREILRLTQEYESLASFPRKFIDLDNEALKFILQNMEHDMRGWAYALAGFIDVYLEHDGLDESLVDKFLGMIREAEHSLRTYRLIVKTQRVFLGEAYEKKRLNANEIESVLRSLCLRFQYGFKRGELELDAEAKAGNSIVNLLIDEDFPEEERFCSESILVAIFQAVKNAMKVNVAKKENLITIHLSYSKEDHTARIKIIDNGIGISYDELKKTLIDETHRSGQEQTPLSRFLSNPELHKHLPPIFIEYCLFERGRSVLGGTGLGLNMLSHICRINGGYPEITNAPNGGAAVTLSFPDQGCSTDDQEKAYKILRFNQMAQELTEQQASSGTLLGEYFSSIHAAWVQIFSDLDEDLAPVIGLHALTSRQKLHAVLAAA